jgi:hypothetical protein
VWRGEGDKVKLFLAGADQYDWQCRAAAGGSCTMLGSYYYIGASPKKNDRWARFYHEYKNKVEWIVDSGLYTMMFGAGKGKTYTKDELLKYTGDYLRTMRTLGYDETIVEMDVHKVLGVEHLPQFRGMFEEQWGVDKTIFVWHVEEGMDGWHKLVERYPFVAISCPELRIIRTRGADLKPMILDLIRRARAINPNVRVHLLGNGEPKALELAGYYSADTLGWKSGVRFANFRLYRSGELLTAHLRSQLVEAYKKAHRERMLERVAHLEQQFSWPVFGRGSERMREATIEAALQAEQFCLFNKYINGRFFPNEQVDDFWQ